MFSPGKFGYSGSKPVPFLNRLLARLVGERKNLDFTTIADSRRLISAIRLSGQRMLPNPDEPKPLSVPPLPRHIAQG